MYPFIPQQDNNNYHNTLHDNLKNYIKNESIKEFQITIDSYDRNILTYPDPFNFRLSLNTTTSSSQQQYNAPFLNRNFRNVKYIKIDSIILPKYYDVIKEDEEFIDDVNKDTTNERFIILRFNNLGQTFQLGTNDVTNQPSILLYPYKQFNSSFSLFKPVNMNTSIIYVNDNNLINLNNIEFSFYDGQYKQITFSNKIYDVEKTDKRHPLNISKQVIINLRVGIYENSLNTEINYR